MQRWHSSFVNLTICSFFPPLTHPSIFSLLWLISYFLSPLVHSLFPLSFGSSSSLNNDYKKYYQTSDLEYNFEFSILELQIKKLKNSTFPRAKTLPKILFLPIHTFVKLRTVKDQHSGKEIRAVKHKHSPESLSDKGTVTYPLEFILFMMQRERFETNVMLI